MELPPYRVPMLKSLIIHMWDRSKIFLKRMGKVILIGSIIIWALSAFPRNIQYYKNYDAEVNKVIASYEDKITRAAEAEKKALETQKDAAISDLFKAQQSEQAEKSFIGHLGKAFAPLFAPLGRLGKKPNLRR
jgi:ferrous iron transport protein B